MNRHKNLSIRRFIFGIASICMLVLAHADDESFTLNIASPDNAQAAEVHYQTVYSLPDAIAALVDARESNSEATETYVVNGTDEKISTEDIRAALNNPKAVLVTQDFAALSAAVQTQAEFEKARPNIAFPLEEKFKQRKRELLRFNNKVSLVKAAFVGGIQIYFIYSKFFDHILIPAIEMGVWHALLSGAYSLKVFALSNDFRIFADTIFNSYEPFKKYAVPIGGPAEKYFPHHYVVAKKIMTSAVGTVFCGVYVTALFSVLYALGLEWVPDKVLLMINEQGHSFSHLTMQVIKVGLVTNIWQSALGESFADVGPTNFLRNGILSHLKLNPHNQMRTFISSSALIGAMSSFLILGAQLPGIGVAKNLIVTMIAFGIVWDFRKIFTPTFAFAKEVIVGVQSIAAKRIARYPALNEYLQATFQNIRAAYDDNLVPVAIRFTRDFFPEAKPDEVPALTSSPTKKPVNCRVILLRSPENLLTRRL